MENGKIVKTRLNAKDIIKEKKNKNWDVMKFALPEVKEGSVIEVSYNILSDFYYNLRAWEFQYLIPNLYSDYKVEIPEYYRFNPRTFGYCSVSQEKEVRHTNLTIKFIQKAEGTTVQEYESTSSYDYREDIFRYTASDIPAFVKEKYLKSAGNYMSKIEFELSNYHLPWSSYKSFSSTWESVVRKLIQSYDFGKQLDKAGFLKDEVALLKAKKLDRKALVVEAFKLVKKRMVWNELSRLETENVSKAWKAHSGNSADINLALVVLLRALDINAYPVAVSTQKHGVVHPAHASISSFNYVVAMAEIGGNRILLDATDDCVPAGLLPVRCLNGQGRIIDENFNDWVDLLNGETAKEQLFAQFKLEEAGHFSGGVNLVEKGYAALKRRKLYSKFSEEERYVEDLEKELAGSEIAGFSLEGIADLEKPVKSKIQLELSGQVERMGDMMVFCPMLKWGERNNPFRLDERGYPVEYSFPEMRKAILVFELPQGYEVESLPKPINLVAPDKSCKFTFVVNAMNNQIQVMSNVSISKTLFLPEEYLGLKNFYASMISKHQEKIVLKKMK